MDHRSKDTNHMGALDGMIIRLYGTGASFKVCERALESVPIDYVPMLHLVRAMRACISY